jgi:hypothetical protein
MEHPPNFDDGREPFDHAFARKLIGKYVLVGVTVQDKRGELRRHEQFHGTVVAADAVQGVCLTLQGSRDGETKWMPPATHVYSPAEKGEYRLKGTGEVVVDPDFTSQWTLTQPDA